MVVRSSLEGTMNARAVIQGCVGFGLVILQPPECRFGNAYSNTEISAANVARPSRDTVPETVWTACCGVVLLPELITRIEYGERGPRRTLSPRAVERSERTPFEDSPAADQVPTAAVPVTRLAANTGIMGRWLYGVGHHPPDATRGLMQFLASPTSAG